MPVIYVCCFASVMRKQVDYQPLNSIYGSCRGRVHPLFVYQTEADNSILSKVIRGSKISKLGHMTPATPTWKPFYGPYVGEVRPLRLYQISSSIRPKIIRGHKI